MGQPPELTLTEQIDLARLVDMAAQRLKLNIEYDATAVKGTATLRLGAGVTDAELWELANQLLASRGFTTVRAAGKGGTLSVVKLEAAAGLARLEPEVRDPAQIPAGFAFDPHVGEEAKRYGKLTVLPVRINADIAMGDLLKKTGAANLFMIFGEPDIDLRQPTKEELVGETGKPSDFVVVEVRGLDVYDPTTGEVRSNNTDQIACWFIDTEYNGESFFVRHAYFTGAGDPYLRLKRSLRAEIDEGAWSALYSTVSRPFRKPESGRIAVKVINHFGDEVLQVYPVK